MPSRRPYAPAVARDIIDDRLLGALHLTVMDRRGFDHDPVAEHTAFQVGTLDALMDGHFDGDATLGELLAHGDTGIGTVERLAGEMIVIDGRATLIEGDGTVADVVSDTRIPFAVVCRFTPTGQTALDGPCAMADVLDQIDALGGTESILAIRIDGDFTNLRLRSVHAQSRPYPSLVEVTEHQTEWRVAAASGTVVGFRFPDRVAGVEVPGHHLHFLAEDRRHGGHVLDLTLTSGRAAVDGGDDLHVELPEHVGLGVPGAADRAAIRAAERAGP